MFSFEYKVRVRYAETDKMGVVYHANYLVYMEVARVEALRSMGIHYADLEEEGTLMPVVKVGLDYKGFAKYDEELCVKVNIAQLPSSTIQFDYLITNKDTKKIANAFVVLAFLDAKSMRPKRPPSTLIEALAPFFHEKD